MSNFGPRRSGVPVKSTAVMTPTVGQIPQSAGDKIELTTKSVFVKRYDHALGHSDVSVRCDWFSSNRLSSHGVIGAVTIRPLPPRCSDGGWGRLGGRPS